MLLTPLQFPDIVFAQRYTANMYTIYKHQPIFAINTKENNATKVPFLGSNYIKY